jgi:D-alanine-D-alanine ligase-like ATP-grasp enzyme
MQTDWIMKLMQLKCRISKKWEKIRGGANNVYVWDRIPLYKEIWQKAALDISAVFTELEEGIWEIRSGSKVTYLYNHMVQIDDPVITSLAAHKPFCYSAFLGSGLPVPEHLVFKLHKLDEAKRFMESKSGLFVVKPAIGTSAGMGVTTHIKSGSECRDAAVLASLYNDRIIIERLIAGESYRILVLNDRVIHASRRSGLRVRGDGESTIEQLLREQNDWCHDMKESAYFRLLNKDLDLRATLQTQGLARESIPDAGRDILVKSSNYPYTKTDEVRTVYTENVTDLLCNDIRTQAVQAARCLNSRFAGVDIITLDPSIPLEKSGGVINEINTTPGLQHHYNLRNDSGIFPATIVLKYLLETSSINH